MKRHLYISLFIMVLIMDCGNIIAQQTSSGRSEKHFVNITKDPPKPAFIELVSNTLEFVDPNGNQLIDANESAIIRFTMQNSGAGEGFNLKLKAKEVNKINGISFQTVQDLGNLKPGAIQVVEMPVFGNMYIPDGTASFVLQVDELNGFGTV